MTNHFGPMTAAYEHMLQYLEEGISGIDWLQDCMVCNVWQHLACVAMGGETT